MDDLEKLPLKILLGKLTTKQFCAIASFILSLIIFSFGSGYKIRNHKLEAEIYKLEVEIVDCNKYKTTLTDSLKQIKQQTKPEEDTKITMKQQSPIKNNNNKIVVQGQGTKINYSERDININTKNEK